MRRMFTDAQEKTINDLQTGKVYIPQSGTLSIQWPANDNIVPRFEFEQTADAPIILAYDNYGDSGFGLFENEGDPAVYLTWGTDYFDGLDVFCNEGFQMRSGTNNEAIQILGHSFWGDGHLTFSCGSGEESSIELDSDDGNVTIYRDGNLIIPDLPDEDPEVEGALWNDNGTLKISAGPQEGE